MAVNVGKMVVLVLVHGVDPRRTWFHLFANRVPTLVVRTLFRLLIEGTLGDLLESQVLTFESGFHTLYNSSRSCFIDSRQLLCLLSQLRLCSDILDMMIRTHGRVHA